MSTTITRARFKELLTQAAIGELFIELGWDHADDALAVEAGKARHQLRTVANKRGFAVLVHTAPQVPDRGLRQSIEKKVARIHYEHLIVFRSADGAQQVWQLAIRRPHQPITFHETTWHKGQEPELLYQKLSGLFIPLEQEQSITLVDVRENVTREFEKQTKNVTKKFYTGFKQEHDRFLKFIEGLNDQDAKKWYASLMLNRLMFIYFMQRKGFMNGETDYLTRRLEETRKLEGKDKFYGFYRQFLRVLFHKGLGNPDRTPELEKRIGKVPYLNGGLFDEHPLEEENPRLKIKDEAFQKLFEFFDTWNWTLDTRRQASGREINPDVIGYIFEQYINDRAQLGAYYTKEDITDYIGKNTIIPWLFDTAKAKDAQAFKPGGGVWELLQENPDRYIYSSVRHGIPVQADDRPPAKGPWWQDPIFHDLPPAIKKGLDPEQKDLWKIRKAWNKPAPADIALPTELYREVIERRRRYIEVRRKLVAGEVRAINDLITYNLDITQFAQDVIHETPSSDLVWAFYDAIQQVTVLDPTCGSGAFLFAGLGILQPLYEECLKRMQWFVEVDDEKGTGRKHPQFRAILARVAQHPNRDYFIYKSIILQNLYGVDIMPEAVEIAKLRLFLKLVSTVTPDPKKPSYGIEPLPDIDFNIRAGNTLVGFGTKAELDKGLQYTMDGLLAKPVIEEKCDVVAKAFAHYKQIQLGDGEDYAAFHAAKATLLQRLKELRDELDRYLGKQYGKDPDHSARQYAAWKQSHKPFHWFAEYYGIVEGRGGFDVIIGNPPYVSYGKKNDYAVVGYETLACGNLYPLVMERSSMLTPVGLGRVGMIVMLNVVFADSYLSLRKHLAKQSKNIWLSTYDNIPDGLFAGSPKEHSKNTNKVVSQRVCIALYDSSTSKHKTATIHTTHFQRWNRDFRKSLFDILHYGSQEALRHSTWPALGSALAVRIDSLMSSTDVIPLRTLIYDKGASFLQLAATPRYFITAVPTELNRSGRIEIRFPDVAKRMIAECALNSTLFYWYWRATGDGFHLTRGSIDTFPVSKNLTQDSANIKRIVEMLGKARKHSQTSKLNKGQVVYNVNYNLVPDAMPQIDALLAHHYGLSEEELDFVINYDIKYRMGDALEGAADE